MKFWFITIGQVIFFKTGLSIYSILFLAQLGFFYYHTVLNNCARDQWLPKRSIVLGSNKILSVQPDFRISISVIPLFRTNLSMQYSWATIFPKSNPIN